jgi:hypothetical protein
VLRKSWKSYKAARREGYEDRCLELEYRINSIQSALGSSRKNAFVAQITIVLVGFS